PSSATPPSAGAAAPAWRAELLPFLGHRNRRMQPIVVHVDPGARLDALPFEHEREDLFFVLSGEVVLVLRGGREIRLREGDAAYLLLETLETVENRSDGAASCLWVASPAE
ncbi:MAG: cupin domain-containing protein, partial [Firmicutes bacterium]|nr:cupin domain-containing protein [Bacillota bacterium]